MFSYEICKNSKNTFFTYEFQWLLLTFNSCFQRSSEQKPVQLSAINTRFSWKKVFAIAKIQKQPPQVFCKGRASRASVFSCEYCEISILKNICDRLFLKISIPEREVIPEFYYPFKPYSILNLCNMFRQGFSVAVFFSQTWYFYHKKVVS